MKNFETLKKAFPIFVIKNKKSVSKNILLRNNEHVIVPGDTEVKVASEDLIQMPDATIFSVKSPKLDDLIEHNVIKKSEPEPTKESSKDNSGGDGKAGSGNKS